MWCKEDEESKRKEGSISVCSIECTFTLCQEQDYASRQAKSMDEELKRILDEQKDERKMLEMRFLDAQQDLKRSECNGFRIS